MAQSRHLPACCLAGQGAHSEQSNARVAAQAQRLRAYLHASNSVSLAAQHCPYIAHQLDILPRHARLTRSAVLACSRAKQGAASAHRAEDGNGAQHKRSGTVLLVKNLPATAAAADLARLFSAGGGAVERVLLPPSRCASTRNW